MIPALTVSGVLPPFVGSSPATGGASPYAATMSEVAQTFCTSAERAQLFRGLAQLRKELVALGFSSGAQWIDGSFCEDVEGARGRPPGDIDVVTLLIRPPHLQPDADWQSFLAANERVFKAAEAKRTFGCEAYYIDVGYPAAQVWNHLTYWFGLFSHQRATFQWKGLLMVPLISDDEDALKIVDGLGFGP